MSDKMKVRDGNDGYSYPYTSPDLVVDKNGKSNTSKFNEIDAQFKDIAKQIENVGNPTQEQINTAINKAIEDGKITGSGININNVKTILSNIMNILYQVNEYKTDMSSLASQTVDLINNLSSGSSTSEEVIVSQDGTTLILTNVSGITNISQDGTTLILK